MAIVYPDINTIKKMKPQPTEGELYLVETLQRELPDAFNVYFQPFIEGDKPDVILMSRETGITIIEVKDWNLKSYKYKKSETGKKYGEFRLVKDNQIVGNPLLQVQNYKSRLFELYIAELFLENKRNKGIFGSLIKCVVYFHKGGYVRGDDLNDENIRLIYGPDELKLLIEEESKEYKRVKNNDKSGFCEYNSAYGYMNKIIGYNEKKEKHITFYDMFRTMFSPASHRANDVEKEEILFDETQKSLIKSKAEQKKIKGVAGSGKTLILARRAVSAFERTGEKVLIITFNITMKNYIKDRISEVRKDFKWENFYMINYHLFIKKNMYDLNINYPNYNEIFKGLEKIKDRQEYKREEEIRLKKFDKLVISELESVKNRIEKYQTILIDEGQDFRKEWFDIIKKYFLKENGEFVIFADEKQNIYSRETDKNRMVRTNIVGD